jgi:hypothetical protein
MSTITDLKDKINTKTINLVLLGIATAGIYPILWLHKNYPIIDNITKTRTADNTFIIWLAVCVGLSSAFSNLGEEAFDILSAILYIASWVLYIIWAFKARDALQNYALNEHKIDLKINAFYTVLFSAYYINYCINDLPEVQRKQQILSGKTENINS